MSDYPISLMLAFFLAKDPLEQVIYIGESIPRRTEVFDSPLCPLLNSIQTYLHFFFDNFHSAESQVILEELYAANHSIVSNKLYFLEDFLERREWGELRRVARKMLISVGEPFCELPNPIPLRDWTYHFHKDGYS